MAGNSQETWTVIQLDGKEAERCNLPAQEKHALYRILKYLLADPYSLQEGEWAERSIGDYAKQRGRLVYGKKSCEFTVLDERRDVPRSGVAATLDIYLRWREGEPEEAVSLVNLQRAQNELAVLGISSTKANACFTLAKRELVKEPCYSTKGNCKLQIVCDEVTLAFRSGRGSNEITVMYDDQKSTATCHIALWKNDKCTLVTSSL